MVMVRGEDWSILASDFGAFSLALVKDPAREVGGRRAGREEEGIAHRGLPCGGT